MRDRHTQRNAAVALVILSGFLVEAGPAREAEPPWTSGESGPPLLVERFRVPRDLGLEGWEFHGGSDWHIGNGQLDAGSSENLDGPTFAILPDAATGGTGDYHLRVQVWNTVREGYLAIAFRYQDASNYYSLEYRTYGQRIVVSLNRFLNGERFLLDMKDSEIGGVRIPDITFGAGPKWGATFRAGAIGDRIFGGIGDRIVLTARDDTFSRGRIALAHHSYHPHFDDLVVYGAGAPHEPVAAEPVKEETAAPPPSAQGVLLEVALPTRDEALAVQQDLVEWGIRAELQSGSSGERVVIGPIADPNQLDVVRRYLRHFEYEFSERAPGSGDGVP